MFSTCIFCHSKLGANESIDHFPIGRRLVFDAKRGRLWVVCSRCERWNLSPLEERWEAVEECERLFAETRLRVSTDNIGLARLRDGLELVRIGAPLRPEMAAWRYGDQFGRRRRKHLVYAGLSAVTGGLLIATPFVGAIAGTSWVLWSLADTGNRTYQRRRVRVRLKLPDFGQPIGIRREQLQRTSLVRVEDGWALRIMFDTPIGESAQSDAHALPRWSAGDEISWLVTGDAALRAAGKVLPTINAGGAKRHQVQSAVQLIGEVTDATSLFQRYAGSIPHTKHRKHTPAIDPGHVLTNLPTEVRLALEMAAHENSERLALEGELALLETAWREAEEIAAIADDMLVSDETRRKISDLKRGRRR